MLGEAPLITLRPDAKGAELVLASMKADAIEANMEGGHFVYWVHASQQTPDAISGLIGLRNGTHLYQLFVARPHHRKGIGRRLWNHMCAHWPERWPQPEHITVNASPFGLAAYEAYGFQPTGPRKETNGVAFIPMRCALN